MNVNKNRIYTLKDVKEVYRFLSVRSLQTWVKRGVIIPAQPASGRGTVVGFDYLNLIEIGLVMQLVKFGFDRYQFLKWIMQEARSNKIPWMGKKHGFDGFFSVEEQAPALFAPNTMEWKHQEIFGYNSRDAFSFHKNSRISTAKIIVDIRMIKEHVDKMIRNYVN